MCLEDKEPTALKWTENAFDRLDPEKKYKRHQNPGVGWAEPGVVQLSWGVEVDLMGRHGADRGEIPATDLSLRARQEGGSTRSNRKWMRMAGVWQKVRSERESRTSPRSSQNVPKADSECPPVARKEWTLAWPGWVFQSVLPNSHSRRTFLALPLCLS